MSVGRRVVSWRDYETYITRHLQRAFPGASITQDVKRVGVVSKTPRQIDILIEQKLAAFDLSVVVDCKYFSRRIDVTTIDAFVGFLADVQASKGILITNRGYSDAAYNRATYDTRDVEIRIIDFTDLERLQNFLAIPYAGNSAALVSSPPGWVVDSAPRGPYLCSFYPAGMSQEEAFHHAGFVYLVISKKTADSPTLKSLLDKQDENLRRKYQSPRIEYGPCAVRDDCKLRLRIVEPKEVPDTVDCTLFLDFPQVVIFLTLLTDRERQRENLKKLHWIAQKLVPISVVFNPSGKPLL